MIRLSKCDGLRANPEHSIVKTGHNSMAGLELSTQGYLSQENLQFTDKRLGSKITPTFNKYQKVDLGATDGTTIIGGIGPRNHTMSAS